MDISVLFGSMAAIFGGASIWYAHHNNKPHIKVKIFEAIVGKPEGPKAAISVKAINTGKVPVILTRLGVRYNKEFEYLFLKYKELPTTLNRGESVDIYIEERILSKGISLSDIDYIFYEDSLENRYKINFKKFLKKSDFLIPASAT